LSNSLSFDAILQVNEIPYQYPGDNRAKHNSDFRIFRFSDLGFSDFVFSDFRISYFRISGSHISVFSDDTYTLPYVLIFERNIKRIRLINILAFISA
jgi:hypothetical protein